MKSLANGFSSNVPGVEFPMEEDAFGAGSREGSPGACFFLVYRCSSFFKYGSEFSGSVTSVKEVAKEG